MDLFESPQFSPPVIILQTVMEEVRHRSLPLYNRLKALIKSDDRNVWVFYNEFRSYVYHLILHVLEVRLRDGIRETAIVREERETPNDRNDRSESVVHRP